MKYLLFHGSLVLLSGLIAGLLYWAAILRDDKESLARWRVAHSFLVIEGMFMLVAGVSIPHLVLGDRALQLLVWTMVLSGYAFVYAFLIGALKGIRGLWMKPFGLNTVLFAGHFIGATGSLMGTAILIYGFLEAI